jgi:UDP-N-acetylmuramoyl-tripeptide--D-alanyl-D-alanine ligase
VVLNVGPVHLERAGSIGRIASAKAELVEALPPSGLAVLNADDPRVASMDRRTAARLITFGLSERADMRASSIESRGLDGFSFNLTSPNGDSRSVECHLPGSHHIYAVLAAIAVALEEGMSLDDTLAAVEGVRMELRLTVRAGHGGATIIDDSYNASPDSMIAALNLLAETPGRHIAVLGHMRELGAAEIEGHVRVGQHAARTSDTLVVVGGDANVIAESAASMGHDDVHRFADPDQAAAFLKGLMAPGDHVLVKASRAVGLEALVEALQE